MYSVTVSNLKVSCKVHTAARIADLEGGKKYNCFIVIRKGGFCYTIFYTGNHVNITGIRSSESTLSALWVLRIEILQDCNAVIYNVTVDNMLLHCNLEMNIDIRKVYTALQEWDAEGFLSMTFNVDAFPALQVKCFEGTLLIFGSGKIVMHCKREPIKIRTLLSILSRILTVGDGV